MGRTRRNPFATTQGQHYVVIWDLQWQVIDCRCLGRGADLRAALSGAIQRLERCGWQPEGGADFGFVFMTRAGERRLVTVTERDPLSATLQSFSPFDGGRH